MGSVTAKDYKLRKLNGAFAVAIGIRERRAAPKAPWPSSPSNADRPAAAAVRIVLPITSCILPMAAFGCRQNQPCKRF